MTDERRFNDKEVALILKRAAETSQAKTAGGLSVEELERIAVEAGLDPAAVRQAAEEVSRGEATDSGALDALIGGPTSLRYRFEIDGELDEEHHEALLAAVQRHLDLPGTLNTAGRTFSWNASSQTRSLVVQIQPLRGKTVVRVEERLGNLIGGVYGGVGGGVGGSLVPFAGIGGSLLFGPLGAVIAVGLGLVATYAGTRGIFSSVAKRRKKTLDALATDLRQTLEEMLPAKRALQADRSLGETSALERARERQGLAAAGDVERSADQDEQQARQEQAQAEQSARRRS